jgi:hypothetical protein
MAHETIPLTAPTDRFKEETLKMIELRASDKIEDQLMLLLMESTDDKDDPTGLWYEFALAKAKAILKRFNVTNRCEEV